MSWLPQQSQLPKVDCRLEGLWLLLLFSIHFGLILGTLLWHELWSDEFHTFRSTADSWSEMLRQRAVAGHPPAFYLLEKAWVGMLGHSAFAHRSLAAILGSVSLGLTYALARQLINRSTSFWIALCMLASPAQLTICQIARSYTMMQASVCAVVLLAIVPLQPRVLQITVVALCAGTAFYTHNAALIALSALALAIFLTSRNWSTMTGLFVGLIFYLPYYLLVIGPDLSGHVDWIAKLDWMQLLTFPASLILGSSQKHLPATLVILMSCGLSFTLTRGAMAAPALRLLSLQVLFTWLLGLIAATIDVRVISVARYFSPSTICQVLVAGAFAARDLSRFPKFTGNGCFSGLALTGILFYLSYPPFTSMQPVARFVQSQLQAGETLVVYEEYSAISKTLPYYYPLPIHFANTLPFADAYQGIYWVQIYPNRSQESYDAATFRFASLFPKSRRFQFSDHFVVHFHR